LSETEEVRAESELLAEEQGLVRERLALAAALDLASGDSLRVVGDLADRTLVEQTLSGEAPARRADVLAADREVQAARAARSLGRSELLPGLVFRLNYGHENGDPLVQPGLGITVPLFQYGQEGRGVAQAREERAKVEVQRIQNAAAVEIRSAETIYASARHAADSLAARALPRVSESEAMIRESYRAGKIDLPGFLVVRRDLLETRREYLDRLLGAAVAGIDLAVARGHFQR
jgi:cobalt-zinc-cadmium efflux system outer membrane protein